MLCLDGSFATGGPAHRAGLCQGCRKRLSFRLEPARCNEGIDLTQERASVEKIRMRYFNIPVVSSAPRPEQADEFIRLVKETSNHPMLINCSTANRVGAFMMIYRVLEQGWSEEKALDEALKIGLRGEELRSSLTATLRRIS